jgi:hypothetical protein
MARGTVKQADLESAVARLTRITGRKFELSGAYGGWSLREADGWRDVLYSGHVSKRELLTLIQVYTYGIMDSRGGDQ